MVLLVKYVLNVPFEEKFLVSKLGAVFEDGFWVYTGQTLPAALTQYLPVPYSWEHYCSGAKVPVATVDVQLRDHQREGADRIAAAAKSRPGFLLADETGLGKTFTAWEAILRVPAKNVLIVCPLSVVPHWRRSVAQYGDVGVDGVKRRVVVINYDRLLKLVSVPAGRGSASKKPVTKKAAKKKVLSTGVSLVDWDVIIWDESHGLRNYATQRAKTARIVAAKTRFQLWVSATAGVNPLQLSYLAPLLSSVSGVPIPTESTGYAKWAEQTGFSVKVGRYGDWEWDPAPKARERELKAMNSMLFGGKSPVGLRRRPEDLVGWPSVTRSLLPVTLTGAQRALYDEAWTEFRKVLKLGASGRDPASWMAACTRFRQKASLLRVPAVVQHINDYLDAGFQVAVSAVWSETVTAIVSELKVPAVKITGEVTGPARESERLKFQTGEASVCVFTIDSGISLHANETMVAGSSTPRVLLVADPRWSPLQAIQVEGRCHRDGNNAPVTYLFAEGTIEEKVLTKLLHGMGDTRTMHGDEDSFMFAELSKLVGAANLDVTDVDG